MLIEKLTKWTKSNLWICYVLAAACFIVINGAYLYITGSMSGSIIVFTAVCVLFWCFICTLYFYMERKKNYAQRAFLIILLVLGTMYSLVFQPMTAPDEQYHFQSSYKYSDYIMFKSPSADAMLMRSVDVEEFERIVNSIKLTSHRYAEVLDGFELFASNTEEISVVPLFPYDSGSNPPQIKLPSAIGITVARLFGLGFYPLFYLGRLFNFLFFACLCYFAVRITPIAKNAFIAIALLPMTLHITSSYSYDAGIIGLSFLFVALCLKAIYSSEKATRKDLIAIAIIAFLLAPCKVVYSLLAILVLIIPITAFSSKKRAALYKAGVLLIAAASVLVFRLSSMISLAGINRDGFSQRGDEIGYFHTITEFFTDPFGTIMIFAHTLTQLGNYIYSSIIGGSLGWFQVEIIAPWYVVIVFSFLLILAFIKTPEDNHALDNKHRALYFIIVCVGLFGIMLSMFTGHTFIDEKVIMGVQGRYLLPFIPLVALALRSNVITSNKNLKVLILFGMLAFNLAYLTRLFATVLMIN